MNFAVEEKVFACFPGMQLPVVVARGVDNNGINAEISKELALAWVSAGKAAAEFGNPQSHPAIKPWGEYFRALGVSRKEYPSSIEALVRRAGKDAAPRTINPLVDMYNAVSLLHLAPAGGFDLDQLENGLELRFSREGDEFESLDDPEACKVPAGEVSYADGARILTRHFVWRQAKAGLILPTSRNVLLVSEVLGELGTGACQAVLERFAGGIRRHFRVEPEIYLLNSANSSIRI